MGWFKTKKLFNVLSKELNRYQIQIYNFNGDMIYCDLHEGFSFDEACAEALVELKKQVNIKTILLPIKFHYSGLKTI